MSAAPEPQPLPPGELVAVGGDLLLTESFRADAIAGLSFVHGDQQLLVHCTFEGRLNRTTEHQTINVALRLEDAVNLAMQLVTAADVLEQRTHGRPS